MDQGWYHWSSEPSSSSYNGNDSLTAAMLAGTQHYPVYTTLLAPESLASSRLPPPKTSDKPYRLRKGTRGHQKSRIGTRGCQNPNPNPEPTKVKDIPTFPRYDEPIPDEASLEEICELYPNHLQGKYLDAFIQWTWTGLDIYNRMTKKALQLLGRYRIAGSKGHGNRANFLGKRLKARIKSMTDDEVKELCEAPKIRKALKNGSDRYGACKLEGKFPNPLAQRVRTLPQRKGRKMLKALPAHAPDVQDLRVQESSSTFKENLIKLDDCWREQLKHAYRIIDIDAESHNATTRQHELWVLEIVHLTATHNLLPLFHVSSKERYLVFEKLINTKAHDRFTACNPSASGTDWSAVLNTPEVYAKWQTDAADIILAQHQDMAAELGEFVEGLNDARQSDKKVRIPGLIKRAIETTADLAAQFSTSTNTVPERPIQHLQPMPQPQGYYVSANMMQWLENVSAGRGPSPAQPLRFVPENMAGPAVSDAMFIADAVLQSDDSRVIQVPHQGLSDMAPFDYQRCELAVEDNMDFLLDTELAYYDGF
ncbi:hypothetical protein A1O3_10083 [Capronia epimyces CBS 606.96]|uniref:Uncharacterized protein n=1 Tax=Capronia epimyces CBS 606.96 TaxID=1182542 RepID=W9XIZ6_9EURO|nr:uncharacterized protein A1O3_10083 [Capronia epimyces CBS 606.96]EXJ76926.1 hypothetical protein A1O3_10083 [Capronia epimyces CBS 606.96]